MRQSTIANEWRAEGRTEGDTDRHRQDILTLLQIRFHTKPPEIVALVNATQDYNRLSRWFEVAATADSLAAFQAVMDE